MTYIYFIAITDQFATDRCYLGQYGDEIGSDQFGASIMMAPEEMDSNTVIARIEGAEMTYMGQAFRLGRYPLHFHLMGDASTSYVRKNSIHQTFNRGLNIHNTHNIEVTSNVFYHCLGGTIFLEDGAERGNTFTDQLVIMVSNWRIS